jgi:NADPH:quinone reductase
VPTGREVAVCVAAGVMATAYGDPEVLSMADEPTPEPGPGEARIEVRPRDRAGQSPLRRVLLYRQFAASPGS